jgi:phage terminase small subunit
MWVLNKAYEQVYKFAGEFGMSPAKRASVTATKVKDKKKDKFKEFGT